MANNYSLSNALHQRALHIIPGGVSSNNRANWQPHPLFFQRAEGAYVWDVDGNKYIDYVLGRGPLITGHSNPFILEAIERQYRSGQFFAGQTELEMLLAEKIHHHVPGAEMIRFCNSGSEAVHVAIRLARAATGREKIIRFQGHYHGWFDNIAWGFSAPLCANEEGGNEKSANEKGVSENSAPLVAMSLGQPIVESQNIISLNWNDVEALEQVLASQDKDIAAVITEPVMFNSFWSNILPEGQFLSKLRSLCTGHDVLLIFDEIQTGFRTAMGGAQSYFGVTPDICTFAKAMGGPVCLAAIAGKECYMRLLAGGKTLHTGTYNAFPPFLAGALKHLGLLSENNGALLRHAHHLSGALHAGLLSLTEGGGLPMQVRASPGAVTTTFTTTPTAASFKAKNYRTARQQLNEPLMYRWHAALQERGVRITPEGLWYVSSAHRHEDIQHTLEMAAGAYYELEQSQGL